MSSSASSFWAAKSNGVKSTNAPADTHKPVAQHEPPKKRNMVTKSMLPPSHSRDLADRSPGAANGLKKTNWADTDDEEEFLASFTSSSRITELEKAVVAKDARITDLSASLKENDYRIAELESAAEAQSIRLKELEGTVDASMTQIDKLEKEHTKQALHVQQLIAGVDEKNRLIAFLETEVDEQCATIAELDVGDNLTQVSSHDVPEASKVSSTDRTSPKSGVNPTELEPSPQVAQPENKPSFAVSTAVATPAKATPSKAAGPAINLTTFPIFATSNTAKQITPPPPAPKLKMPVDLSKFAKKSTTKLETLKKESDAASLDVKTDGPVPKIDPTSDIRTKCREERSLFASGPKVEVKMGDATLDTVPKYVLMQCSSKAFKHFSDNPDATSFHIPAATMDDAAAKAHLGWMKEMTYQGRVYSITLHSDEKFDDKNLQICRSARVLGLNNMYVGHFTKIFCDRIRSNTASDAFLSKVAAVAYPKNDPIYDCLANNLANSRLRKAVKNPAALEALLQSHKHLKTKVEKIEERMRKKQDGTKPTEAPTVVRVGKKMDV